MRGVDHVATPQGNKAIVRKYFDVLTRNDYAALIGNVADDDMHLRVPGTTCISGVFLKPQAGRGSPKEILQSFPKGPKSSSCMAWWRRTIRSPSKAESIGTPCFGEALQQQISLSSSAYANGKE